MKEIPELVSVPIAAQQAEVARNTMLLAAKQGKIKAVRLGRDWYIYPDDIDRWKRENYQPAKIRKKKAPPNND